MVNIHNYERMIATTLERIRRSSELSEANREFILCFKDYLQSDGIGIAKINRYLGDLMKFNRLLGKQFDKATKEDIRRVVSAIHNEPLSEQTKRCFKILLRKFYCYLRNIDEKGVYPEEVKWMKMAIGQRHKKLPEELLTEEEIKKIVQACTCIRDKALIATLAESGCRISEIGIMQIKHILFEPYGARLSVTGKTGARKILVVTSTPYLQEWINSHPKNTDPELFLWIHPKTGLLCYHRILAILKSAAVRVCIKKRVHPHLLRHSKATQLASIMSDSQLKNYLGWTQGSNMAGIYVHMSGKDTDDAILRVNHIDTNQTEKDPALQPLTCLRCKAINPATHRFCNICGFALDEKAAQSILIQESKHKDLDVIMNLLMKDKEVLELLTQKIKEVKL